MLYVFHVDTGSMINLDLGLAMETVSELQEAIKCFSRIPESKQVLLVSGGQTLDSKNKVCSYSAGTDTNPIFLFSKTAIESNIAPSASVDYGSDADLREHVEAVLDLPVSFETVAARVQLSIRLQDIGKELLASCEKLVRDQHLQYQGWLAVIANLEDTTNAFSRHSKIFAENFQSYLNKKPRCYKMLRIFPEKTDLLGRIPLLPCLASDFDHSMMESQVNASDKTLLDWINAKDSKNTLPDIARQCQLSLEQLSVEVKEKLMKEVEETINAANDNQSMKEVKGVEDRFFGLDQLMSSARKLMKQQADMATGMIQNQNRVSNLRDPTILPDLCESHQSQLQIMMQNSHKLFNIKQRVKEAKEEFTTNLHIRLRWVMYVEREIQKCSDTLLIHHEKLRKLERRLQIVEQMVETPRMYANSISEILRRRHFSAQYSMWAHNLSERSAQVYDKEIEKRNEFALSIDRHFLQGLFHGFQDRPARFANPAPPAFDLNLPKVTEQDIEFLRCEIPELSPYFRIPTASAVESLHNLQATQPLVCNEAQSGNASIPVVMESIAASDIVVLNDSVKFIEKTHSRQSSLSDQLAKRAVEDSGVLRALSRPPLQAEKNEATEETEEAGSSLVSAAMLKSIECTEEKEVICAKASDSHMFVSLQSTSPLEVVPMPVPSLTMSTNRSPDQRFSRNSSSGGYCTGGFFVEDMSPMTSERVLSGVEDRLLTNTRLTSQLHQMVKTTLKSLSKGSSHASDNCLSSSDDLGETLSHCLTLMSELQKLVEIEIGKQEDSYIEVQMYHTQIQEQQIHQQSLEEDLLAKNERIELAEANLTKLFLEHEVELERLTSEHECFMTALDEEKKSSLMKHEEELQALFASETAELKAKYEAEIQNLQQQKHFQESVCQTDNVVCDQIGIQTCFCGLDKSCQVDMECLAIHEFIHVEKSIQTELFDTDSQTQLSCLDQVSSDTQTSVQLTDTQDTQTSVQLTESQDTQTSLRLAEEEKCDKLASDDLQGSLYEDAEMFASMHEVAVQVCIEDDKTATVRTDACLTRSIETQTSVERLENSEMQTSNLSSHGSCTKMSLVFVESDMQTCLCHVEDSSSQTINSLMLESSCQTVISSLLSTDHYSQTSDVRRRSLHCQTVARKVQSCRSQTALSCFTCNELGVQTEEPIFADQAEQVAPETAEFEQNVSLVIEDTADVDVQTSIHQAVEEEKQAMNKALTDLEERHQLEIDTLLKEKEDEMVKIEQQLRTNITAERQVKFNAAIRSAVSEKEKLIEHLRAEIRAHGSKIDIAEAMSQSAVVGTASDLAQGISVQMVQSAISGYASDPVRSHMSQSIMPVSEADSKSQIYMDFQRVLIEKEEELEKANIKIMQLSMAPSADKISINSCVIGDVVLFCLDENHDHYVVFSMANTLHFLHYDSMATLGLAISRPPWILAVVTDKEYCQARKANNRFRVAVNTRFYRVRAEKWPGLAGVTSSAAASMLCSATSVKTKSK